jgi:hypothetical protein
MLIDVEIGLRSSLATTRRNAACFMTRWGKEQTAFSLHAQAAIELDRTPGC